MSVLAGTLHIDSKSKTHKCKRCRKCKVCHQCLQVTANICREKFYDTEDEIRVLCESSAHNHYKDKRPRYIIVGPNNEKLIATNTSTTSSADDSSTDGLENEMQDNESDILDDDQNPVSLDCLVCGKTFETKHDLDIHNIYHSTEEVHECKVCGKQFDYSFELIKHSLKHKSDHFICFVCQKELPTEQSLKVHSRVHTEDKPFVCEICNKAFKENSVLKSHYLVHSDEKPFQCDKCGKCFQRKCGLHTHSFIHAEIKPFSCYLCSKTFSHKCNYKTHLFRTHKLLPEEVNV